MNLSSELISQWAKVVNKNNNSKVKRETTVYGTTVEKDNVMYVQLDGSDILTPTIATADTKAGERVVVMIKNHSAVITGNVSSPAARTEDVQSVASTTENVIIKADTLEEQVAANVTNVSNLRNDLNNLHKSVGNIVEQVNSHDESITEFSEALAKLTEDLEAIVERLDALEEGAET